MVKAVGLVLACVLLVACNGTGGIVTPSPAAGGSTGAGGSLASAGGSSAPAEAPITSKGPSGWDRGPYDLAGGDYRLDWTSDGNCSALYFGIVGVSNGYVETPPTAGDVALKDMKQGSRVISSVPAGSYFFNVSGVACKSYSATLSHA